MSFEAYELAVELNRALAPLAVKLRRADRKDAEQLQSAAKSIARNLSEGSRRLGRDRLHHFSIAAGSAHEVKAILEIAVAWGHLSQEDLAPVWNLLDRELAITWRLTHPRAS